MKDLKNIELLNCNYGLPVLDSFLKGLDSTIELHPDIEKLVIDNRTSGAWLEFLVKSPTTEDYCTYIPHEQLNDFFYDIVDRRYPDHTFLTDVTLELIKHEMEAVKGLKQIEISNLYQQVRDIPFGSARVNQMVYFRWSKEINKAEQELENE